MKIKNKRLLCFLFLCAMCLSVLSGCAGQSEANKIYTTSGYRDPISQLFPDYKIAKHDIIALDLLRDGGIIEAYDAQAENSAANYWYPLTLETVVIAVDRDQTDMKVNTWSDLKNSGANISITNISPYDRIEAAALCYGLDGERFTLAAAVNLLEPLYQNGKLKLDDENAPIQICFDSAAAARIKNGENIEIIVPSEGTLTFIKGLLSNNPLELPDGYEQILIESGLRLIDGRCDEAIYPSPVQYTATKNLENYDHFNTVMQNWLRTLRRDIRHIRLYTSADQREHILFAVVFIIVAVIWIGNAMRRSQQQNIRRVIFAIGIIIVGWVITRVIKYQIIDENALTRYLWYGYFIFQTLLPLGMLRIASLIGTGSENRRFPKWFMTVLSLDIALIGLVMTNDLHGMMFKLDLSQAGWSATGNYSYGIIYFIVMAALLIQLIAGIVLLFTKTKHSPRRFRIILPVIFTTALVIYVAGYALNVPVFAESDMTLMVSMFALIFLELCIRAGHIPVNTNYRQLFQKTGLNLQITDRNGVSVFASDESAPLDAVVWERLIESDAPIYTDDNTLLLKHEISGGYAVWRKDITAINKLKNEIEAANCEIEAANVLLSNEAQEKERDTLVKTQVELYAAFEKDIAAHEQRLDEMLRHIPEDEPERAVYMGAVAVLVCYIKRRCNFLALEMSGTETSALYEYVVYIDELAELARLAGIKCLTYCNLSGEIKLRHAMLFYDFFYAAAEWTIMNKNHGMIAQTLSENEKLVMRLVISGSAAAYTLPKWTEEEITLAGGIFEKKELDEDGIGLFLSFPEGGERNV